MDKKRKNRKRESSYIRMVEVGTLNNVGIICCAKPCAATVTGIDKNVPICTHAVIKAFRQKDGYAVVRGQMQKPQTLKTAQFAALQQRKKFAKNFQKMRQTTCKNGFHTL